MATTRSTLATRFTNSEGGADQAEEASYITERHRNAQIEAQRHQNRNGAGNDQEGQRQARRKRPAQGAQRSPVAVGSLRSSPPHSTISLPTSAATPKLWSSPEGQLGIRVQPAAAW